MSDEYFDYDDEYDCYVSRGGKLTKKGTIVKHKDNPSRPVGSHTKFLAREASRRNRTRKEK